MKNTSHGTWHRQILWKISLCCLRLDQNNTMSTQVLETALHFSKIIWYKKYSLSTPDNEKAFERYKQCVFKKVKKTSNAYLVAS